MIKLCVRQLCILSVLCGAAMSLCPEGSVKNLMNVLCTAVLLLSIAVPLKTADLSVFSVETAKLRQREAELTEKSGEITDSLNRLCIQQQCEAYIKDKAAKLGITVHGAKVRAEWSTEGLWVPYSARIICSGEEPARRRLGEIMEAELGIPEERQSWEKNE